MVKPIRFKHNRTVCLHCKFTSIDCVYVCVCIHWVAGPIKRPLPTNCEHCQRLCLVRIRWMRQPGYWRTCPTVYNSKRSVPQCSAQMQLGTTLCAVHVALSEWAAHRAVHSARTNYYRFCSQQCSHDVVGNGRYRLISERVLEQVRKKNHELQSNSVRSSRIHEIIAATLREIEEKLRE